MKGHLLGLTLPFYLFYSRAKSFLPFISAGSNSLLTSSHFTSPIPWIWYSCLYLVSLFFSLISLIAYLILALPFPAYFLLWNSISEQWLEGIHLFHSADTGLLSSDDFVRFFNYQNSFFAALANNLLLFIHHAVNWIQSQSHKLRPFPTVCSLSQQEHD